MQSHGLIDNAQMIVRRRARLGRHAGLERLGRRLQKAALVLQQAERRQRVAVGRIERNGRFVGGDGQLGFVQLRKKRSAVVQIAPNIPFAALQLMKRRHVRSATVAPLWKAFFPRQPNLTRNRAESAINHQFNQAGLPSFNAIVSPSFNTAIALRGSRRSTCSYRSRASCVRSTKHSALA